MEVRQMCANPMWRTGLRWKPSFLIALLLSAMLGSVANAQVGSSDQIHSRLRISWGGPKPLKWQGSISVESGQLNDVQSLGLTSDTPGTIQKIGTAIQILQLSPVVYSGLDVTLVGDANTMVQIDLSPVGSPAALVQRRFRLSDLIKQDQSLDLGDQNRLTISRAPGDQIRVEIDRPHLVFEIGEQFRFRVQPNQTGLPSGRAKCSIRVFQARTTQPIVWSQDTSFEIDSRGSSPAQWIQMAIPASEGVFDVQIEFSSISSNPRAMKFLQRRPISVSRSIQLVALSRNPPAQDTTSRWKLLTDLGAGNDQGIANVFSLASQSKNILRSSQFRQASITLADGSEQTVAEIPVGGFQAVKLPLKKGQGPYRIEIDYGNATPTSIGFSLLQQDSAGQIPLYGFDCGVNVPESIVPIDSDSESMATHRFSVWPNSDNPFLLISNRHEQQEAIVGRIRVFQGPSRLKKPTPFRRTGNVTEARRKLMAFYESPLFAEHLGADKLLDPKLGQPVDDWETFYRGTDRLIQHLVNHGYQGAFLSVLADGSALFPSRLVQPTPKYDSGIFDSQGRDPIRKDVVEMIFRMFERSGLQLVPTFSFSSSLPAVERYRRSNNELSDFELVDFRGIVQSGSSQDLPFYNPLDHRVQRAVNEIVREFSERYGNFDSYGGTALICRPDTQIYLPGRRWGYDTITIQKFMSELRSSDAQNDTVRLQELPQFRDSLLGQNYGAWMSWRRDTMSAWFKELQGSVKRSRLDAKVYIAPVDLYRNSELEALVTPTLHRDVDLDEVMLRLGIDARVFLDNKSLVMLRPIRRANGTPLPSRKTEFNLNNSLAAVDWFENCGPGGTLMANRANWVHFQKLERMRPFATQQLPLMRMQPLAASGNWNAKRFAQCLAADDSPMIVDGGDLMAVNQSDAMTQFNQHFAALPAAKFTSVACRQLPEKHHPLAVRQYREGDQFFWYAVNPSPWTVTATIHFKSKQAAEFQAFDGTLLTSNPDQQKLTVELKPFQLLGGVCENAQLQFTGFEYQLPPDAATRLKNHYYQLHAKLVNAGRVKPIPGVDNADFERQPQEKPGWTGIDEQAIKTVPELGRDGSTALQFSNESGSAWIRSREFVAPRTGRLSISVWLKLIDDQQPPLRICVECMAAGESYYRFGSVGQLAVDQSVNQIESKWKRFAVHFDDLPNNVTELSKRLRIGFDMMGPGKVLIDDVQIYDRWFDENDIRMVTELLAGAGPFLSDPAALEHCRRSLSTYWPTFINQNFEAPSLRAADTENDSTDPDSNDGIGQKFRRLISPKTYR